MAGIAHRIYQQRNQRQNSVYRNRFNALQQYDDVDLHSRFRFRRADILQIVDLLTNDLQFVYNRTGSLSPEMQVLLALRLFATGTFQVVVGDTMNVHKSTVSRAIHRVEAALCRRARQHIYFPTQAGANEQKRTFHAMTGFLNAFACVDGTQICIQAPTVNEHEYVNRCGDHSLNVQIVCDSNLRVINCVVKYPGSAHVSRILRESCLESF